MNSHDEWRLERAQCSEDEAFYQEDIEDYFDASDDSPKEKGSSGDN